MTNCKIYSADTVDNYGNVWPTVGENIRNGLFGLKTKTALVEIANGVVTSSDINITNVGEKQFIVDKLVLFAFPISCRKGDISIRISQFSSGSTGIISSSNLASIVGTIGIVFGDVKK